MSIHANKDQNKDFVAIEGTSLFNRDALLDIAGSTSDKSKYLSGVDEAYNRLFDAFIQDGNRRSSPPAKRLKVANKYVPILLRGYAAALKVINKSVKEHDRTLSQIDGASQERSRKRWTKDEDEFLIDSIARGDSALKVSSQLGRTSEAIKTRVSYLVGISKVESDVAGTFIGTLNGVEVSGNLEGKLKKQPKEVKR